MRKPFRWLAASSAALLLALSAWAQEGKPNPGAAPGAPPQQPTNQPTTTDSGPNSGAAHNPDQIPPNPDDQLRNPLQKNSVPADRQGTTSRDSSRFPDQTQDMSKVNVGNSGSGAKGAQHGSRSIVGPGGARTQAKGGHQKKAGTNRHRGE